MTDAELWAAWRLWMAAALVIVFMTAALLVLVWGIARGIRDEALRALAAVETIRKNTEAVWALEATNDVALHMAETVEAILRKGGALVQALEGKAVERHAK